MKLQTQIPIKKETRNSISHNSSILLLGSCFSENIGNQLNYFKFNSFQNPFGILFHPKAIETLITNAINEKVYSEKDIVYQNERWHCLDAHSNLSSSNKEELLTNLNTAITVTQKKLKEATHIIITLGTAWVYRFLDTDAIVANCHKISQKKFLKELLSSDEVSESIAAIITLIKSINKDTVCVFTVSPVRHLKDGFIENTQSKSHLITGIHNTIDARKNSFYFPSFEIMMDELRDYRFYAEDMIHPNKTAINYIWEKFSNTWFTEETTQLMKEVDVIQKGLLHKPFNENSEAHQKFLADLKTKIEKVNAKNKQIYFS